MTLPPLESLKTRRSNRIQHIFVALTIKSKYSSEKNGKNEKVVLDIFFQSLVKSKILNRQKIEIQR